MPIPRTCSIYPDTEPTGVSMNYITLSPFLYYLLLLYLFKKNTLNHPVELNSQHWESSVSESPCTWRVPLDWGLIGPLGLDDSRLSRRFHSPPDFISWDFIVGDLSLGNLISLETRGKRVSVSQSANSLSQWMQGLATSQPSSAQLPRKPLQNQFFWLF